MKLKIKNEEETRIYGRRLAATLRPGDVVCLVGDLGTGKTALTKAVAEGLGITEQVVSPTFNIVKEYHSGRLPLYHFDVYRLESPAELFEIGAEEYFNGDGVCLVEWADMIGEYIPSGSTLIEISYGDDPDNPDERIYEISTLE